jgi:hypothetical protein
MIAPGLAACVEIQPKPGYDPFELFLDPAGTIDARMTLAQVFAREPQRKEPVLP